MRRTAIFLIWAMSAAAAAARAQCPPSGTDWCSGAYQYDAMGNIRGIGQDVYEYDTVGRLVSGTADVQRSGVSSRQKYAYDGFGNRTSATRDGGSVGCIGGCELPGMTVLGSTNRISGASYDPAGNVTVFDGVTYAYDGSNSLTESSTGSEDRQYVYTAEDERIATKNGASWTWTVRYLDGKILREFTSGEANGQPTANRQWAKDYVWRDGGLLASLAPTSPGASTTTTLHYHLDHLGTPRLVTLANGSRAGVHAYYGFGGELSLSPHESPEELLKFTGHERDLLSGGDVHSLDYMHARYYMATAGRFLSVDPSLDLKRTLPHPQMWNRYAYVVNNPIRYDDPTGREIPYERGMYVPHGETPLQSAAAGGAVGLFTASFVLAPEALAGLAEGGFLLARNPGLVLAAMKFLDAMGGNVGSHINPTGQTGNKLGYLLGEFESSGGKGGLFAGVLGFGKKTLDAAIRSHFAENFAKAEMQENGRLAVTGTMTGANGVERTITTIWQWNQKTKAWDLITGFQAK